MAETVTNATDAEILAAARAILDAHYPIALTGAGMSVESGIPAFPWTGRIVDQVRRAADERLPIFLSDPKKAWEDRIRRQNDELWGPLKVAKPNQGHTALAELEAMGVLRFLITQNVDDLHHQAGHTSLAEITAIGNSSAVSSAGRVFRARRFRWRCCRRNVRNAMGF